MGGVGVGGGGERGGRGNVRHEEAWQPAPGPRFLRLAVAGGKKVGTSPH